ncbi:GAF and ANTAR domain-containing protein [uncultured Jatrophihabitans sp.]|uniref:GAF and ANTAR domain-containing protein n=1 Tax=uncultured Jatrophihabitans sp. TaxID=1610747 RepID=UPI0035CB7917
MSTTADSTPDTNGQVAEPLVHELDGRLDRAVQRSLPEAELTWTALGHLARALRAEGADVHATLERIVSHATEAIEPATWVGIALLERNRFTPQAVSGRPPHDLDVYQGQMKAGPCFDVARTQKAAIIEDTAASQRWPDFCARAVQQQVRSMLCVPLWVDERRLGTLSLFSAEPSVFAPRHLLITELYSTLAALALADAQRVANLHAALESRDLLGQAKGILIERERLTPDAAFARLAAASQAANRKVTAVAQHLVETGELLGKRPGG